MAHVKSHNPTDTNTKKRKGYYFRITVHKNQTEPSEKKRSNQKKMSQYNIPSLSGKKLLNNQTEGQKD